MLERPASTDSPGAPRWRLAALAAAGVVLGIAVAVGLVLASAPETPEVPEIAPALPVASVSASGRTAGAPDTAGGSMVISVVGKVARPGLVTLPEGSRVADALEAAGGPARGAQLGGLNLARRLSDGEQIYVGVPVPPGADPGAGTSGGGGPGGAPAAGTGGTGPVDLNSASLSALDTLPGIGPVTAQRIIDWRTQNGRFASVEQLREIEGIGPTRFARLKDLVVVW
ncbi:hypothetical protein BU204_15625 [Actinophytocola xanthii]|uniref:Helix-hairpin-helix DNA-binding motif class 1 domain-containing protein n=1 Tax=Actinophytocola xanthii TaxID=1912961 RepID=A0A1Q8CQP9_9PSEU|nr:hypothetical protein BU204_15625 [Actinophytocola xanthii]